MAGGKLSGSRDAFKKTITFDDFFKMIFEASVRHHILTEYFDISSSGSKFLDGSTNRLFGLSANTIEINSMAEFYIEKEDRKIAEETFKNSLIWSLCAELYEYAIHGIRGTLHWIDLVEDVNIYMQHIHSDFSPIHDDARILIDLASLRFGLDKESDRGTFICAFDPFKVIGLMAKLDERTVKNADSQGLFNGEYGHLDFNAINTWLRTKRGFIPTKGIEFKDIGLEDISTVDQFGGFLHQKRKDLGKLFDIKAFTAQHFLFTKKTIDELESGQFNLPLNVIPILASAYLLGEKELLSCIMRIFFPYQLSLIKGEKND